MSSRFRHRSTISFSYLSYYEPVTKERFKLPLVNVRLIHKTIAIKTIALVDSGSTSNFLPLELAEVLQLDLSNAPEDAVGAGGNFESISTIIGKCRIIKGKNAIVEEFPNLLLHIPVKAGTLPYMVLGRDSIFRRFDIRFQERNEKFILKRISP